ncbi:LysR family substrate-binding domain-containing protein [Micromonospora sp. CPCC 205558]|uniref:LysR family substrate-binding domain-containing protein n=1 Tax=Micromonospora sp. CPCC 205558 TaxID=3122403 RepID=UPI002FF2C8C5
MNSVAVATGFSSESQAAGTGAVSAINFSSRSAVQKAAGTVSPRAATSSAMRPGFVAPGIAATVAGWARENCSAAALTLTPCRAASALIRYTFDLNGQPWIAVGDSQDPAWRDTFVASCVAAGFTPDIGLNAADPLTALGLVASGLGLALVQRSMVRGTTQGIVVREIPWYGGSVQLWAAWHRVDLRPVVASFRETVLGEPGAD